MKWTDLSLLHQLASRCVYTLHHPPDPLGPDGWTAFYNQKMMNAGYVKSESTVDQLRFSKAFHQFVKEVFGTESLNTEIVNFCEIAAQKLVRKHRHAIHPVFHLMLQCFLDRQETIVSPFGIGPWPCLNPLVTHNDLDRIKVLHTHRNHDKIVGVFQCDCGYTYTRNYCPTTGQVGLPRLLKYGKLLAPVLRERIASGSSLRAVARSLQLDPKTVIHYAQLFQIKISWKTNSSHGIPRARFQAPSPISTTLVKVTSQRSHAKKTRTPRLCWQDIDRECRSRLTILINNILTVSPPIRISLAEIERRMNRRGWLGKHSAQLPISTEFIGKNVESTEAFQLRRIDWHIEEQFRRCGEVLAWRVMRGAGLRSTALPKINERIGSKLAPLSGIN